MLTANRFDEIKKFADSMPGTQIADLSLGNITKLAVYLKETTDEIDRLRSVPQIKPGGHVKPLILDPATGKPLVGPPLAQQFAGERREQYQLDRAEALQRDPTGLDPNKWRIFALRWGLSPPPGGWEINRELIINMMHRLRVELDSLDPLERHVSAMHCKSNGIALPHGYELKDGQLHGPGL